MKKTKLISIKFYTSVHYVFANKKYIQRILGNSYTIRQT